MLHLFDNIPRYVQNPAISAYLTENGCFWNKIDVCVLAASNGHINILEWLQKNNPAWDYNDHKLCLNSAMKAHQTLVIEWLQGCTSNKHFLCVSG